MVVHSVAGHVHSHLTKKQYGPSFCQQFFIHDWFFGKSTPALATHMVVIASAVAAYFWNIQDIHACGWLCNFVNGLNLGQSLPPADQVHYYLCAFLFAHCKFHVFPNMVTRWSASQLGCDVRALQVSSAIGLGCVGCFWYNAAQGYIMLMVAFGFAHNVIMCSKKTPYRALCYIANIKITWLAFYCANNAVEKFSNYHHALAVAAWFWGSAVHLSMYKAGSASAGADSPKRSRSTKRSRSSKRK